MNLKLRFTLFAVIISILFTHAQQSLVINVAEAGTLNSLLGTNKTSITELTLTGTIKDVDFTTIKQMTSLKNLNLENVVIDNSTIPFGAFASKTFNELILPKSLKKIASKAFYYTTLPNFDFTKCPNLETIGYSVFEGTKLDNYTLDFSTNSKLKNFLSSASEGTFTSFTGHVILPDDLEKLPSFTFRSFYGRADLSLKLRSIEYGAFMNSTIEEISLPRGVTSIKAYSFSNCTKLTKIISNNATPPSLGNAIFSGVDIPNCRLTVPDIGLVDYAVADQWKDFINTMRSVTGLRAIDVIEEKNIIKIYPNPTSDILNVDGNVEKISLYSATGRFIKESKTNSINLQDLVNGIYIVTIKTSDGTITEKVIKK